MPFIEPLPRSELSDLEDALSAMEKFLGFVPNDVLTMAHHPAQTRAFMDFCLAIYQNATLPHELLHLIGMATSAAAGCRYCTAHTANKASEVGVDPEKVAKLWEYESSPLFDSRERAAITFALNAGQSPSQVGAEDYQELRKYYTEAEIVEMLFVICQFGFWNRWNDSVGTQLEAKPKDFAETALPEKHWSINKHT